MLPPADAPSPASSAPSAPAGPTCPACAAVVASWDAQCRACGAALVAARARGGDAIPVTPALGARVQGVLLDPGPTFAAHEAGWGWFQPWLLVVVCGVALGLLRLARIDVGEQAAQAMERGLENMPVEKRRQLDKNPDAVQALETWKRMVVFGAKAGEVLLPPLAGLIGLVSTSSIVFMSCLALRSRGTRPDLAQAVSLAAHVGLIDLVGLAARAGGTLVGNPAAQTSPAGLVDAITRPVLHAALARLDPVLALWWVVLAVALGAACRVPRRIAVGLCGGLWLAASLLSMGWAAAMVAMNGGGGA